MKKRIVFIIILIIASFLSIMLGAQDFSLRGALVRDSADYQLLIYSRIPRLLAVLVTGAGLSISGKIMQTMTGNRFVSPTTAGTMEWCKFGILLSIIFFGGQSMMLKMIFAFIIALFGSLLFVQLLQRIPLKSPVMVPLIGLMLGNVVSSLTAYISFRYDLVQNISSWLQGNFSLVVKGRYELLYLGIPFVILAYLYAKKFTIAGMGESFAKNLGLNYRFITIVGFVIVAFLASIITVSVGSIAFLGLIIPNIVSIYYGDDLKHTLFDTALLGGIFLLFCDILSRIIVYPYEISVSVIVSVLGGAIFLFLLFQKNKEGGTA
ncbi:ABC transporter permease [Lachnoclostridium phytofermentans]|uniref:Transport system permease protein n=1 Tax=Lachnoclostridium phytofermentans (strain ATCC 700394 / DSM 18823 / ISDg) TaxID=357809 RepID=A9KJW3_LACP7|nr:iron chelate uptake ABC transporter family permease subunit [Lachnoclostridium phytofermentans]ABX41118.1 transport system permease protein [Lachnoclostridium phytofermentans ISDg]